MVKTAGNTFEWIEHNLTVLGKGGYRMRAGNTVNALGGELPIGQAFALSILTTQLPIDVIDDYTTPLKVRKLVDYSVSPLRIPLDQKQTRRISGAGLEDFAMGGYYIGTTQKIYRFKILATGSPDTIAYKVSTDGGTTFSGSWLVPSGGANITGAIQPIADGITIAFTKLTGHTAADEWEFWTPMPQYAEVAQQTTGSGEVLTTAIKSISGKLTNEALDDSETVVTVDGSHGIVVNDVIIIDAEKMHVTGVSTNDLTVTREYENTTAVTHLDNAPVNIVVTASHRQVFVVKIIAGGGSQNTFKYSTDGGVTFDNGGGSTDGSGNLNIPGSPFTHTLRKSDNSSYGITITFSGTTGYTTNDAFSFHIFPTTVVPVFTQNTNRLLLAWVENRGETKVKHKFLSAGQLESTESMNIPSNINLTSAGIAFGGQDLSQSTIAALQPDNQYASFNSYLSFADTNDVDLGGLAGQKTSITNNYAPFVTGVRGNDNTDYAHYIFNRGSTIDFPLLDMNRGMINNLTSLSQSVHTQGDYCEQMATIPGAITTATTLAYTLVANDVTSDDEMNVNQILALVPSGGNQWSNVKYDDVTELVKVTANDEGANNVTVIRGYNPATGASEANLIKSFDAGAGLWRSWDDSAIGGPIYASTSGARQHVRIPPNNALTSRTTQSTERGWAYLADIETNGKGPYMLVLERNQAASTGLPDAPWNTQWRQQGGSWGNIEITGSNTVVPIKSDLIENDVLTFIGGSGITVTGDNTDKEITFATSSSKRYKENIEKLTLDTSKIYNLTPRTFTWKKDAPTAERGQSDFGLIAEEVEEIFPEITFNNAKGQVEGIKYITLSVLLLEELKKLRERVSLLELEAKEKD